ncbi:alpha-hydroxy-acid oxidizing protein [Mesorhizobium sp. M7A.F.Ca.US.001.04.1.1]|uniref:alpha-hydroxy-acid oxidizing protein n=1 Tax=Mesorhizobium sp. M7A.F.Ca.US.001.04.1.1 TaxID=2496726 RepID=UPI001FDFC232|nr:alpha-hydroxy-acid oxidizing protein [Mesorhizobium sp. M7A.F.Ca.US.001.04.1.1]
MEAASSTVLSSIDALPAIRQALGAQIPILIDSGIRTGTDIVKAKARGATVAAIGRAALFGAVAGEPGVAKALDIILDEVVTCLRLCGIPRFQEAGSEMIA